MKRQITGAALAVLLAVGLAAPAQAYDYRTGSRTCASGYNVSMSTTTTSSENHIHFYRSTSGQTKTRSTPSAVTFGSTSFYRAVDLWTVETQGWFSGVKPSCARNPL